MTHKKFIDPNNQVVFKITSGPHTTFMQDLLADLDKNRVNSLDSARSLFDEFALELIDGMSDLNAEITSRHTGAFPMIAVEPIPDLVTAATRLLREIEEKKYAAMKKIDDAFLSLATKQIAELNALNEREAIRKQRGDNSTNH